MSYRPSELHTAGLHARGGSAVVIGSEVPMDDAAKPQVASIACDSCHSSPCVQGCARALLRVDFITAFPCAMKWRPCSLFMEFTCCLLLAFFLGMSGLVPGNTQLSSAIVHGSILVGAIAVAVSISGAHFSGFLSLVIALNGGLSWFALLLYWLAQFLGFITGTALVLIFFSTGSGLNCPAPQIPFSFLQAFAMEIIGTFAFTLFVLFTQRHKVNVALTLGVAFIGIVLIGLPISGASFNFWRFLAPAIFTGAHWPAIWVYLVGEFLGAILAWIAFRVCCWLEKYNDLTFGFC